MLMAVWKREIRKKQAGLGSPVPHFEVSAG
jgi:hypothetical protein